MSGLVLCLVVHAIHALPANAKEGHQRQKTQRVKGCSNQRLPRSESQPKKSLTTSRTIPKTQNNNLTSQSLGQYRRVTRRYHHRQPQQNPPPPWLGLGLAGSIVSRGRPGAVFASRLGLSKIFWTTSSNTCFTPTLVFALQAGSKVMGWDKVVCVWGGC